MRKQFILLHSWMLDLGLTLKEVLLYALIFNHTENHGAYIGSMKWSGRWCCSDERETKVLLGRLIRRGLISCVVSGGRNTYKALYRPSPRPRARDKYNYNNIDNIDNIDNKNYDDSDIKDNIDKKDYDDYGDYDIKDSIDKKDFDDYGDYDIKDSMETDESEGYDEESGYPGKRPSEEGEYRPQYAKLRHFDHSMTERPEPDPRVVALFEKLGHSSGLPTKEFIDELKAIAETKG